MDEANDSPRSAEPSTPKVSSTNNGNSNDPSTAKTPPSESVAQTIAASAIATALHSTCFQPSVHSPVSTPLRGGFERQGSSNHTTQQQPQQQQQQGQPSAGKFVAEPPDWSVIREQPSRQPSVSQQYQPTAATPLRNSISSTSSSMDNMFSLPSIPYISQESPKGGGGGSITASFSGSSAGGGAVHPPAATAAAVLPPSYPSQQQQPQISMSRSGDTISCNSQNFTMSTAAPLQQQGGGTDASVLLGLEELERQQADLEKRRANEAAAFRKQQEQHPPTGLPPLAPTTIPPQQQQKGEDNAIPTQIHFEDEETLTSEVTDRGINDMKKVNSMEKLGKLRGQMSVSLRRFRSWSMSNAPDPVSSVDSTQKETISRSSVVAPPPPPFLQDDEEDEEGELQPIINGYLHKLGRNGHWQKRFFETNGRCLTYYKSDKRTKVLATLDLCKVGEIAMDPTDPQQSTFTIQVSNRPYYLRAANKIHANDWVITLNRAREARLQVGNIQLHTPHVSDDPYQSQAGMHNDEYAPCIVISALRPRTHGSDFPDLLSHANTDEEGEQIEVMENWDRRKEGETNMDATGEGGVPSMAKWQKKHSTMHQLSLRFLKWARSITKQADACRRESDVVVVPAHVLRSFTAHPTAAATPHPTGTSSARRKVSGSGSDLPVLAEEAPEGRADGQNRSRSSTNSSAGGIVGSQYV